MSFGWGGHRPGRVWPIRLTEVGLQRTNPGCLGQNRVGAVPCFGPKPSGQTNQSTQNPPQNSICPENNPLPKPTLASQIWGCFGCLATGRACPWRRAMGSCRATRRRLRPPAQRVRAGTRACGHGIWVGWAGRRSGAGRRSVGPVGTVCKSFVELFPYLTIFDHLLSPTEQAFCTAISAPLYASICMPRLGRPQRVRLGRGEDA